MFFLGYQLACIQCTSPVRRISQLSDHSCLDGTLQPLLCEQIINGSKLIFKNCVSAIYKLGLNGNGS